MIKQPWSVRKSFFFACALVVASFVLLFVLLAIGFHFYLGPLTYTSEPIRARLIDEHTDKPVEGAVVVALWKLKGGLFHNEAGLLHAFETVTDAGGTFYVPPMRRRLRPFHTYLSYEDPVLMIYKPGYAAKWLHNSDAYVRPFVMVGTPDEVRRLPDGRILIVGGGKFKESTRFSYWNGKTIPLTPTRRPEDDAEWFELVRSHAGLTRELTPARVPLLWRALVIGYERLPAHVLPQLNYTNPRNSVERAARGQYGKVSE